MRSLSLLAFGAGGKAAPGPALVDRAKRALSVLVERIVLSPESRELSFVFRLPLVAPRSGKGPKEGVWLASPRGFEPRLSP